MKRCVLLVVLLLMPLAHAGEAISFSFGGHRIHLDSARCRSLSCVSVSDGSRSNGGGDTGRAIKPVPAPAPAASPAPPPIIVYKPAPAAPSPVAAPPPSAPPRVMTIQPEPAVAAPPPLAASPAAASARPRPTVVHVAREADEPDDGPIGDWQTEASNLVRVRPCGTALCGYALDKTTRDLGEAVLINMKPKQDARWNGSVYSQDSGSIHYGSIELKGADRMRVEACKFGRFYCTGADWIRVSHTRQRVITQGRPQTGPPS